ncbi:hypothetical protein ACFRU3_09350 [Streptomyces sp. NPDC056910]|uniref:hypothetical protein n=1 Tax=Streptomyces sp. NPDC056910 TaxID=3345964 RepID=UPI00369A0F49
MTVRLNGSFGAGRTTTSQELVAPYADALPRLSRAATVVDTTERAPGDVAARIAEHMG